MRAQSSIIIRPINRACAVLKESSTAITGGTHMPGLPQNMLAFTIQGGGASDLTPWIGIGYPDSTTTIVPRSTKADLPDEYYWVCTLDNYRPGLIVLEFIISGSNYSTVPAGLDDALSNPEINFVVTTKKLSFTTCA